MSEETVEPARPFAAHGHSLQVIMRSAIHGSRGDFALVAVRFDAERLIIQAARGPLAEDMVGNLMLLRTSVAADVLTRGVPLVVTDYPSRGAAPPGVRERIQSVIVVPLTAGDRVEGALAVGRLAGQPAFGPAELDQLVAFVGRTDTAWELEGAREERRTARLVEERLRIHDDLHDNVIQELFATGMALHAVTERMQDPELRELVAAQIDALNTTTQRIRSLISDLPAVAGGPLVLPLPTRLIAIVDSLTPALRCLPTVAFTGPVEAAVDGELAEDLEAVLREALSNVARHAAASAVQINVTTRERWLVLDVIDDGRGIGTPTRASGLANMRRRAARHDGDVRFTAPIGGGTHVSWRARLGVVGPLSGA